MLSKADFKNRDGTQIVQAKEKKESEDIKYEICADVLDLNIFVREDSLPFSKQT